MTELSNLQSFGILITGAVGIFTIIKIFSDLDAAKEQRKLDLNWKKAQASKVLIDKMLDDEACTSARTMLDWQGGREYKKINGKNKYINKNDIKSGLRIIDKDFDDKETFIRDSFDALFEHLGFFEYYITNGLVDFENFKYPIEWYIRKIHDNYKTEVMEYLEYYKMHNISSFLKRFDFWE